MIAVVIILNIAVSVLVIRLTIILSTSKNNSLCYVIGRVFYYFASLLSAYFTFQILRIFLLPSHYNGDSPAILFIGPVFSGFLLIVGFVFISIGRLITRE